MKNKEIAEIRDRSIKADARVKELSNALVQAQKKKQTQPEALPSPSKTAKARTDLFSKEAKWQQIIQACGRENAATKASEGSATLAIGESKGAAGGNRKAEGRIAETEAGCGGKRYCILDWLEPSG